MLSVCASFPIAVQNPCVKAFMFINSVPLCKVFIDGNWMNESTAADGQDTVWLVIGFYGHLHSIRWHQHSVSSNGLLQQNHTEIFCDFWHSVICDIEQQTALVDKWRKYDGSDWLQVHEIHSWCGGAKTVTDHHHVIHKDLKQVQSRW